MVQTIVETDTFGEAWTKQNENNTNVYYDGGEAGGADRTLGNTDAFAFGIKTDDVERLSVGSDGSVGFNTESFGTAAAGVLGIANGTAPTTAPADQVQLWAGDYAAGDSRLYVMGEAGTGKVVIGGSGEISIYKGTVERWLIYGDGITSRATGGALLQYPGATSTIPNHTFNGDSNTGIGRAAADQLSLIAGGVEGQRIANNYLSAVGNVTFIPDLTTAPSTNPTGGGVFFSKAGALYWRGSSGTETKIADA